MAIWWEVFLLTLCSAIHGSTSDSDDINYNCQVCRAVVDETFFMIDQVDPKKTIQTGSFRVDSHGNQGRYEVPFARSETHLTEVFEEICTTLHNYGETMGEDNRRTIIRTSSKVQKPVDLTGVLIDAEKQRKLVAICNNLIEDFEEDMMVVFKKKDVPNDMAEKIICVMKTEFCSEEELKTPLPQAKIQDADSVVQEIEKRLAETAPKTVNPTQEDQLTDDEADDETDEQTDADADDESRDKIEL